MSNRIQYNAEKLYLEKKEYDVNLKNSKFLLYLIGSAVLTIFLFVLKFIVE